MIWQKDSLYKAKTAIVPKRLCFGEKAVTFEVKYCNGFKVLAKNVV